VHDYRRHYLDLLDQLGVDRMVLAGHSMGGYLAATFAVDHLERISRLVLAAPLGLKVPGIPTTDLFSVVPGELPGYLTENQAIFAAEAAGPATPEFLADQYRETTSAARLLWESPYDRKLGKWLHRVSVPTLLLWGEADRMVPAAQSPHWADLLPAAEQRSLPGVGHLLFDETPAAAEAVLQFTGRRVLT
jgi:pimeloyl-ACP methyl ester carboxylesterase